MVAKPWLKSWLKNREHRSHKRDGGGKIRKEQTALWTCSAVKGICLQKLHPRIGCAVHGSKEEAERCTQRSQALAA